jgi:hypothetical protein
MPKGGKTPATPKRGGKAKGRGKGKGARKSIAKGRTRKER